MTVLELYEIIKNDLGGVVAAAAPQIEKVANEILTYEFFINAFWGVGSLVLLAVVLLVSKLIYSKLGDSWQSDGDKEATIVITLIISTILLVVGLVSITSMIKIKTAPTYYLIEKAGRVIDKGSK